MFNQKLVHLDLKGAPPKVSYFQQLFPLLRRLGATGILIEYEDTFPYHDHLTSLQCQHAYSQEDINLLLGAARDNQLEVVPLVQTFGHLEFVLKHDCWRHLREVARYPNVICPSNEEAFELICSMLRQVIKTHQKFDQIKRLHIGADEVWHLAVCSKCKAACQCNQFTKEMLFLNHVARIAKFVRDNFLLEVIIWDDMLRNISKDKIEASHLNDLVEPMVWHYSDADSFKLFSQKLWSDYIASFKKLWVASAFKGASAIDQLIPPTDFHLSNHSAWMDLIRKFNLEDRIEGIALTGWQRFDHCTTLCELLPTALPCLTLCLLALDNGKSDESVYKTMVKNFGSEDDHLSIHQIYQSSSIQFPGVEVFKLCCRLNAVLDDYQQLKNYPRLVKFAMSNRSFVGGFTKYLLLKNRTNSLHIEGFILKARVLLNNLIELQHLSRTEFAKIYFESTIDEFLTEKILPLTKKLEKIVKNANDQLNFNN